MKIEFDASRELPRNHFQRSISFRCENCTKTCLFSIKNIRKIIKKNQNNRLKDCERSCRNLCNSYVFRNRDDSIMFNI